MYFHVCKLCYVLLYMIPFQAFLFSFFSRKYYYYIEKQTTTCSLYESYSAGNVQKSVLQKMYKNNFKKTQLFILKPQYDDGCCYF